MQCINFVHFYNYCTVILLVLIPCVTGVTIIVPPAYILIIQWLVHAPYMHCLTNAVMSILMELCPMMTGTCVVSWITEAE